MSELPVVSAGLPAALRQEELYPIREVARLTGVNPVTLRAWERRYGLIQPTRTDSGHRLYSQADIEAVRSVLAWIERGVAVSKVGRLLARGTPAKAAEPVGERPLVGAATGCEWGEWQTQLHRAVAAFDEASLESLYGRVFSAYPLPLAFQEVLLPVWQTLLLRRDGFGQTSEWLFLDTFLRGRVLQRLLLGRGRDEERVLLAALPGGTARHVLSALLYGAGYSMMHTLLNAKLLESADPRRRGAAFGALLFAFDSGIGLGSFSLGMAIGTYGYRAGWAIGAAAILVSLPLALRLSRD